MLNEIKARTNNNTANTKSCLDSLESSRLGFFLIFLFFRKLNKDKLRTYCDSSYYPKLKMGKSLESLDVLDQVNLFKINNGKLIIFINKLR